MCVAGVVPKPARQVAEEGEHPQGSGPPGPQCAPADLQRRAPGSLRDRAARKAAAGEEAAKAGGEDEADGGEESGHERRVAGGRQQ